MILELDLLLHSLGIIGFIVFYVVLAKLSEKMGEGLMLDPYYRLYYIAGIITFLTIPLHVYMHIIYDMPHSIIPVLDLHGLYILMLLLSFIIVFLVSIRYWLWLKDELLK